MKEFQRSRNHQRKHSKEQSAAKNNFKDGISSAN